MLVQKALYWLILGQHKACTAGLSQSLPARYKPLSLYLQLLGHVDQVLSILLPV